MNENKVVSELSKRVELAGKGGLHSVAKSLNVSASHLCYVLKKKRPVGVTILSALGYREVRTLEKIK